jgi:hypothetical protein
LPNDKVEIEDPFTHEKRIISLDRTGHTEKNLILTLADPTLSRDRKDHALSMYLYERGAESTSMIIDLFRYKGQHSKESQVFQSRMRYDFEAFVNSFTRYLTNQSRLLGITLDINIAKEKEEFEGWLELPNNKGKGYTYKNFCKSQRFANGADSTRNALIEMAIYAQEEAEALRKAIDRIVQARMASQGGGIYVDSRGRPFDVNDPELEEIIKADREIQAKAQKDNDH